MAKALFHKHQRVYVKLVGTWAMIEAIKPQWAKGMNEPLRIYYDVGLGRDFSADELTATSETEPENIDPTKENWRLVRAPNKWQSPQESSHHPYPGTFPVVVTDSQNWGGWRVPGSEYDRDPGRIEHQSRIIVNANRLLDLAKRLASAASEQSGNLPNDVLLIAYEADKLARFIDERPLTNAQDARADTTHVDPANEPVRTTERRMAPDNPGSLLRRNGDPSARPPADPEGGMVSSSRERPLFGRS
jgi:hypothetical protein